METLKNVRVLLFFTLSLANAVIRFVGASEIAALVRVKSETDVTTNAVVTQVIDDSNEVWSDQDEILWEFLSALSGRDSHLHIYDIAMKLQGTPLAPLAADCVRALFVGDRPTPTVSIYGRKPADDLDEADIVPLMELTLAQFTTLRRGIEAL